MIKSRVVKIGLLLAIPLITIAAWYLVSPLFIDKVVDEKLVQENVMAATSPRLLKQGTFRDADAVHKGSGEALLYRLSDGNSFLRLENFEVTNGPDLAVYLVKHSDPGKAADVESGYLSLGKLKGNVGNQNYVIPAKTDLSEYKSVVIWCELFGVLFSPAALLEP